MIQCTCGGAAKIELSLECRSRVICMKCLKHTAFCPTRWQAEADWEDMNG